MNRFLLNIDSSELDNPVYRFISFETLCEILLYSRITLPKIDSWDDPYENYLFKTHVLIGKNSSTDKIDFNPSLEEVKSRLFGQCWTLTS